MSYHERTHAQNNYTLNADYRAMLGLAVNGRQVWCPTACAGYPVGKMAKDLGASHVFLSDLFPIQNAACDRGIARIDFLDTTAALAPIIMAVLPSNDDVARRLINHAMQLDGCAAALWFDRKAQQWIVMVT